MAFTSHVIITLVVISGLISGLVHPLTKSNGDPDLSSIIVHITMMEGSMKELKTQVQASHDQLIVVNERLTSTSDELASVKEELKTTQDRLRSAEVDIIILQHNQNMRQAVVGLSNMKSDISELKSAMEHNLTVIDLLSRGLKTNTRFIQALKSAVTTNSADIKKTRINIELDALQQRKLGTEVAHLKTELGQARNMTKTMMAEIEKLKTLRSTAGLLNIKSEISDLKSKARDSINVTIIDELSKELKAITEAIHYLTSTVEANNVKITNTRAEIGDLKMSKAPQPSVNFTVLDVMSKDLMTNTLAIQSLKATVDANSVKIDQANSKVQTPHDQLITFKTEFVMVKTRLNLAEADIITLRNDKKSRPNAVELTTMKSDIAELKSFKAQESSISVISWDLIRNKRAIQALQSTVDANSVAVRSARVDTELNGLQQRKLREEVIHLTPEITNVRNTAKSMMTEIQTLKSESQELSTAIQEVATNLDGFKIASYVIMAKISIDVDKLEIKMKANIVSDLEELIRQGQVNSYVAFQVTQSGDQADWTTLRFDTVNFNQGGAYNKASGYFTAPVSGTYLFWCNILIYNSSGRIKLYKGPYKIADGYTYTANNQVAMTVVTHMDKGEQVHFAASSTDINTDGDESHYGGALLHANNLLI